MTNGRETILCCFVNTLCGLASSGVLVRSQYEFANVLRKNSPRRHHLKWKIKVGQSLRPWAKRRLEPLRLNAELSPSLPGLTVTLREARRADRQTPTSLRVISAIDRAPPRARASALSITVHSRSPFAFAYITVGPTNYPVIVLLINESLMRLIAVVNWLGPSALIPP